MLNITFLKYDFKNYKTVDFFLKNGYKIHQPIGGRQYRINGLVDIYPKSSKIFSVLKNEWVDISGMDMIEAVKRELSGENRVAKPDKYAGKLIKMSYKEWSAQERLKKLQK